MKFETRCIPEPDLEFGEGGLFIDPRVGLMRYGPLQPKPGELIRIGVIGTTDTVEGFSRYVDSAMLGIEGVNDTLGNLHPGFPGLGNDNPFRCKFEVPEEAKKTILSSDLKAVLAIRKHEDAVRACVDLLINQARVLLEGTSRPEVIVVALPKSVIEKVVNADGALREDQDDEEPDDDEVGPTELNFRDLFKARALSLSVPTQIAWPSVWDEAFKLPHKLKGTERKVQDPATRAWNILNAIYYKAGRVPWRLPKVGDWTTSYLGIGFYRDLDGHRLWTSTAQMFDEKGKGLILRGARARTDRPGKHPYLAREDAYDLVKRALDAYYEHHRTMPARIVIMKTSRFEKGEAAGFAEGIAEMRVAMTDMIWVSEGGHVSLLREGDYPPLRGSFVQVGKNGVLYTRGSVPYYGTYPGARVPNALQLRPHEDNETSLDKIAAEVLALTKMNWNSTQFDQALPIPIRAAREVGRVLRHVSYSERDQSDFRYYM
ncbi:hypothetical protein sphantq_02504 [Sphingobium sp. AntQ-1]|uniref:argonaute/piwi family protein n=1 Tax=Sphingobium sp. AntQ-1 TaxID=2930091 RepID=UPI00234F68E8|nr:hypothetical protein [Sphingobium sp. AntQ-1]WCP14062.1 hypothetical protein sphantq_02504 [Sphingobium sp. AntQ-1]